MADLADEVALAAERVVSMSESRGSGELDYSEESLELLEEIVAEAGEYVSDMTEAQITMLTQDFGSYLLEVGYRTFGGCYQWHDEFDQPILVVGEPSFRIAMLAWGKVRSRLLGDESDNLPFFYAGFAKRVRRGKRGDEALFV